MLKQPFIDIIMNVDTATLSAMVGDGTLAPGTPNNPTSLQAGADVFVTLTTQGNLVSNTAPDVVVLRVDRGGQLRWTISGFDSDVDYSTYFYGGIFVSNLDTFPAIPRITYLEIGTIAADLYLPPGAQSTAAPGKKTHNTQRSTGPVIEAADEFWAALQFKVIDNKNGDVIGCFGWTQSFRVERPSKPQPQVVRT